MSDLAGFLRARLDEDEAAAKLAAREGGTWKQDDPERYPGSISSLGGAVVYDEGAPDEYQAAHIARHDPARALREVKAKRAILARYERGSSGELPEWQAGRELIEAALAILLGVLRNLAATWSDHPDYDPAWAVPVG